MRKKRWIWTIIALFAGVGAICVLASLLKQVKAGEVMKGIQKIQRGNAKLVSLSNRVTRILTRTDGMSEKLFQDYMKNKGWNYVCNYGRSGLYKNGSKEVLARKTVLLKEFCIYEVLDENYFRYMKSEIREVA